MHLLRIQPELRAIAEEASETQSRIRGYCPFAMHNVTDPGGGHMNLHRQLMLTQAERFQEILLQHGPGCVVGLWKSHPPAGRTWAAAFPSRLTVFLVVVDDFNIVGSVLPPNKANAKLVIDPNTMLPRPVACTTRARVRPTQACHHLRYRLGKVAINLALVFVAADPDANIPTARLDSTGLFSFSEP